MATKSSIGWLILAFSLAVPSILFYQWRSGIDQSSQAQDTVKRRISSKPFPVSAEKPRPVAAVQPAPQPAPEPPAPAEPPAPQPQPKGSLAQALAELPKPEPQPAAKPDPFAEFRDPTLSPQDIHLIEKDKFDKEVAIRILTADRERAAKPKPKPRPMPEKSISLQGIIYIDAGNHSAIVNGERVREGETVKTPEGEVQVRSISPQEVRFAYGSRRFSKSLRDE